jgi:hypothetical protein
VNLEQVFKNESIQEEEEEPAQEKETNNISMSFYDGSNHETEYVWSHMPEPWQTLVFIYLACIKLREPMMLSELKRMAENGKLPYRNVCTHLFTTDRTFHALSYHSTFFRLSGGINLRNYNRRSYPIVVSGYLKG